MKKTKVIIPALGILLLSTAASVTGTVAWFSSSDRVTANNMNVKARAEQGIVISNETVDEWKESADASYPTAVALNPTSTADFSTWYHNSSDDANDAKAGQAAATYTTLDIKDNKGYNVVTVQADTVPAQLKNSNKGTIAVINGNYAIASGLKIKDALAVEDASGDAAQTYANIIACRNGDENSDKIKALIEVLNSQKVKDYIKNKYDGAVLPVF